MSAAEQAQWQGDVEAYEQKCVDNVSLVALVSLVSAVVTLAGAVWALYVRRIVRRYKRGYYDEDSQQSDKANDRITLND